MPTAPLTLAPATRGFFHQFNLDGGDTTEIDIDPVLNASTIIIKSNDELRIVIYGAMGGAIDLGDPSEDFGRNAISLVQLYPVNRIWVRCEKAVSAPASLTSR